MGLVARAALRHPGIDIRSAVGDNGKAVRALDKVAPEEYKVRVRGSAPALRWSEGGGYSMSGGTRMVTGTPAREVLGRLGDPARVIDDLDRYREAVSRLASQRTRLTRKHPERWVAVHGGEVVAVATTVEELLRQVDEKGLPRRDVIIQFLTRKPYIMVL